ncbi:MAG: hypothetical protein ACT6FE_06950 [Methanosarcinaceae archaeon]
MNDKDNHKADREEKIEKIEKKIERSKQDVPFTERIQKMQAPDPWPDPPSSKKKGDSNSDDK